MSELTSWLKIRSLLLLFLPVSVFSQTLTLDRAYQLSRSNYPLIKQKQLIRQTEQLNLSNLGKGFLPQLTINGQATYQSDVTRVEVPIPNIKIEAPSKDQYKLTADLNQVIYDGNTIKNQMELQSRTATVNDRQLEVELYKLKDRINTIYLGVLYLDAQIAQVELVEEDIETGIKKVEAQVVNGIAFRSNLNTLKAEHIKTGQRRTELVFNRKAMLETLGLFINQIIPDNIVLEKPAGDFRKDTSIQRPEIELFNSQSQLLSSQNKLITSRNIPKTSFFVQSGYGRPGLNLLKNQFDFFYIGGIRLNWSLANLYTTKNDRKLVRLNQEIIDSQKETFMLNTNAEIRKQSREIEKLGQLVNSDQEIIDLRKTVTSSAKAQLENGVITSSDYLREVSAEDQARQSLIAHQIQLLQAEINFQTITGNNK